MGESEVSVSHKLLWFQIIYGSVTHPMRAIITRHFFMSVDGCKSVARLPMCLELYPVNCRYYMVRGHSDLVVLRILEKVRTLNHLVHESRSCNL